MSRRCVSSAMSTLRQRSMRTALERAENARSRALGEALLGRGCVRRAEAVLRQAMASGAAADPMVSAGWPCAALFGRCRRLLSSARRWDAAPQSGWGG